MSRWVSFFGTSANSVLDEVEMGTRKDLLALSGGAVTVWDTLAFGAGTRYEQVRLPDGTPLEGGSIPCDGWVPEVEVYLPDGVNWIYVDNGNRRWKVYANGVEILADTEAAADRAEAAADQAEATLADVIPLDQKGAANGVATLGADSKIPTSQIPSVALVVPKVVASEAAMLALTDVQPGDLAVRTDGAGTFALAADPPSTLANWIRLNAPTDVVTSVNGQIGTVVLAAGDVGAATTAQGATADAAVQPGDLAAVATTGSYNDLADKPAASSANIARLVHNGTDYPARTSATYHEYVGPSAPTDGVAGDTWIDNSGA